MRRNDPVELKHGREDRMNNGVLVIGFILRIGVDNDTYPFGRNGRILHKLYFYGPSHSTHEIALEEDKDENQWSQRDKDGRGQQGVLRGKLSASRMQSERTAGNANGSAIWKNIRRYEHPSIFAASIRALGIVRKNPRITRTPNGTPNPK
jgi:hypothetical protein